MTRAPQAVGIVGSGNLAPTRCLNLRDQAKRFPPALSSRA